MVDPSKTARRDKGVAHVLLMRLNNERLPLALELKKKVDRGERLSGYDAQFLKKVFAESGEVKRLAARQPQFRDVVTKMASLYEEILQKDLENSQHPPPK